MKESVSLRQRHIWLLIALFIIPLSGLSVDIYIPSLPAMSYFFAADKSLVQMSITFYMFGMGVTQIFAGAITDSFGRRKPFLTGMSIYLLATLMIPLVANIHVLLALRLLQGIAVGILIVPIRSITPDLFSGKELHKMMGYGVTAWSIGPIVAPVIGGYLQDYFGWQANFYFLVIYSAIALALVLFILPETSTRRHPFSIKTIVSNARDILSSGEYWRGILSNGLLYSIIILYAIVAPFLLQNVLHLSAIQFGHAALFIGLGWFLGSLINRFTLHVALMQKIKLCLSMMLVVDIILLLLAYILPLSVYTFMIPLFFLVIFGGIIFPNYFARAVTLFPTKTGSANAFMGSFVYLIPSIISAFGALLKSNTPIPLGLSYLAIIIVCLGLCFGSKAATP